MSDFPTIIPEGVLSKPGRPGANDRIVVASIGVGGMGRSHVPADVAASDCRATRFVTGGYEAEFCSGH